jgi:TPR repeat protein
MKPLFWAGTLLVLAATGFSCGRSGEKATPPAGGEPSGAVSGVRELDADLRQAGATFAGGASGKERFLALASRRKGAWQASAEKGEARGQYLWGMCRLAGAEGEPDPDEAAALFRKAADQGLADAQSALGSCYEAGMGVGPPDPVQAASWYRKAADQGNPWAQHHLGICYRNGAGIPPDAVESFRWELKAAGQGLAAAQTAVGFAYENGQGTEPNAARAIEWYRKAADQGDPVGQMNLGVLAAEGVGGPRDLVMAKEWLCKAANQGDELAKRYLIQYGLSCD